MLFASCTYSIFWRNTIKRWISWEVFRDFACLVLYLHDRVIDQLSDRWGTGRSRSAQVRAALVAVGHRCCSGPTEARRRSPFRADPRRTTESGAAPSRQALSKLEQNGIVRRVPGKGTYIHEDAPRRLRSGLDAFAIIVPDAQAGYYPSLLAGFEEASSAVRNQIIVISTKNDLYRQGDAVLQLIDKQVAGVAMVPVSKPPTPAYQVRQLQKNGVPVVLCHRGIEGIRCRCWRSMAGMWDRWQAKRSSVAGIVASPSFRPSARAGREIRSGPAKGAGIRRTGTPFASNVVYLDSDGYADPEAYERLMDEAIGSLMERESSAASDDHFYRLRSDGRAHLSPAHAPRHRGARMMFRW